MCEVYPVAACPSLVPSSLRWYRVLAPQVAVHRGFVDSGRSEVLQIGSELRLSARASEISEKGSLVI